MFDPKKIKTLLDKINWLSNSFQENDFKSVSALEKSLLKEKVLMFYDEIQNIPTSITKERMITEVSKSEQPTIKKPEPIKQIIEEPKPQIVDVFEELEAQKAVAEPTKIVEKYTEPVKIIEKKPEPIKVVKVPHVEISKEEKFQRTEAFQKQVAMPKRDMREIIDLNKSFILKAELFNQNNDSYNQFINEINVTRTEQDAEMILKHWTRKLHWQTEENKAYDLIVRAVEKRFLPLI